jgi:hypothetical protein
MTPVDQTWARDPETTGPGGGPGTGGTSPILSPQNKVSDPVWGVNAPSGGANAPLDPEIPVTKGQ